MLVLLGARYGWRAFGFEYCIGKDNIILDNITINGDSVSVSGSTIDSMSSFVGSIYKIQDSNLYIGLKYSEITGFLRRDGNFNVKIKCNTSAIEKVIIKSGIDEKVIWIKHSPAPVSDS